MIVSISDISEIELQRFWSKVDIKSKDKCWIWKAASSLKGYGRVKIRGKIYGANRIAFLFSSGKYPDKKLDVCHSCDRPECVNPSHLFLGTRSENMLDASKKGRLPDQKERFCKRGHDRWLNGTQKNGYCLVCHRIRNRKN